MMQDDRGKTTSSQINETPCHYPIHGHQAPVDEERAEDAFDIPLGAVVRAAETGRNWVFFGWSSNTAGTYPNFIEAVTPARRTGVPIFDYHAAIASTLERKFPDIARFRRKPQQDPISE